MIKGFQSTPMKAFPRHLLLALLFLAAAKSETLTPEQLGAVVVIEGDSGKGTGFVATVEGKPVVVTNQHVISGQSTLKIANSDGLVFKGNGFIAAANRDLVLVQLVELPKGVVPLQIAPNPNKAAKAGDSVHIPGNSKGDGVITVTPGKIVAFGPDRVEVDNPVFAGNSGSPIIHEESGLVLGVLTEAELVELDRFSVESFNNKDSQIKSNIRYFGHRIDQVSKWEPLNWKKFQETAKAISRGRYELNCIFGYLTTAGEDWKSFEDLHKVRNECLAILQAPKFSDAAKAEARTKFLRRLDSMCKAPVTRVKAGTVYYIHQADLKTLEQIQGILVGGVGETTRDTKLFNELVRRGGN